MFITAKTRKTLLFTNDVRKMGRIFWVVISIEAPISERALLVLINHWWNGTLPIFIKIASIIQTVIKVLPSISYDLLSRSNAEAIDCTMKYFMIDSLWVVSLLIINSKIAQKDMVLTSRAIQTIIHELENRQQVIDMIKNNLLVLPRVVIAEGFVLTLYTPRQEPRPVCLGVLGGFNQCWNFTQRVVRLYNIYIFTSPLRGGVHK